ncbi:S-layer homology domain-containing protein [Flavonifractor sp. An82]|uniref:S-layer homology domain-containing protein n=1 Tax=Flavonifractor sp. An82 TaxID=1965660 RepID=UPI0013A65EBF|nr:S-layer homology domain-containing protein [Flavonifractor sp. An82]
MKRKMWKRLASLALAAVMTAALVPAAFAADEVPQGGTLTLSGNVTYSSSVYHVSLRADLAISEEIAKIVDVNRADTKNLKALRFTCTAENPLISEFTEDALKASVDQIEASKIFDWVSTTRNGNRISVEFKLDEAAISTWGNESAGEVSAALQAPIQMTFSDDLSMSQVWDCIRSASSVETTGAIVLTSTSGSIPYYGVTSAVLASDTCITIISPTASSGSESGSGSGTSKPTYEIEAVDTPNGEVKTTPTRASKGTLVTITVTPDTGYEVASLSVVDEDGNEVEVEDKGNGKYTFTMPASEVSVNVTFAEIVDDMPFVDVAENDWFYDSVRYVYDNGLMEGTSATTFAPTLTTTRSMVATILWRVEGEAQVDHIMAYPDVEPNTWYTEAVRWATAEGIMEGYGDGRFGPNDSITREQLATILYRYAKYKGYDVSASDDLSAFLDADQTGDWAVDAVKWAVGSGLLNGKDGSRLDPQGVASRAEVATMLMRFMEKIAE